MMRVLVIGGTQFVGRHIAEELLARGHEVTILNRGITPDPLPDEVTRLRADRTDRAQLLAAVDGLEVDAVIDCIGYHSDTIAPVVERFTGHIIRYVLISSTSVYQPSELFPIDERCVLNTGTSWEYAREKIRSEQALAEAQQRVGFPWVSLRAGFIYGPYNNLPNGEFRLFTQAEQGRTILVPGDGRFIFHLIHGRDLARAAIAAIEREEANGQVYNILGAYAHTANRHVEAVGEATGKQLNVVHVPHITSREDATRLFAYQIRPTQIYSIEAARRDLDWEPQFDVVEGMRDSYRWYREVDFAATHEFDFSFDDEVLASLP